MSEENVELTRRLVDAWNERDVEAVVELWDSDGFYSGAFQRFTEGDTTVYRGHSGVRQGFRDMAAFSEEQRFKLSEVRDLGDQVLGLGHLWYRFASGVELDQEGAFLHTWRDGKLVEARDWLSHAEALEAAGLRE